MIQAYGVKSITPRCNDSQSNLWLVKNVVEPQKFDQELRVSYKPTAFRRWVVDFMMEETPLEDLPDDLKEDSVKLFRSFEELMERYNDYLKNAVETSGLPD